MQERQERLAKQQAENKLIEMRKSLRDFMSQKSSAKKDELTKLELDIKNLKGEIEKYEKAHPDLVNKDPLASKESPSKKIPTLEEFGLVDEDEEEPDRIITGDIQNLNQKAPLESSVPSDDEYLFITPTEEREYQKRQKIKSEAENQVKASTKELLSDQPQKPPSESKENVSSANNLNILSNSSPFTNDISNKPTDSHPNAKPAPNANKQRPDGPEVSRPKTVRKSVPTAPRMVKLDVGEGEYKVETLPVSNSAVRQRYTMQGTSLSNPNYRILNLMEMVKNALDSGDFDHKFVIEGSLKTRREMIKALLTFKPNYTGDVFIKEGNKNPILLTKEQLQKLKPSPNEVEFAQFKDHIEDAKQMTLRGPGSH